MVEGVAEYGVPLPGQGGDEARVRQKPGTEKNRGVFFLEAGKRLGEFFVRLHVARNQRARAGAGAPPVRGLCRAGGHQGMIGQAQVVVPGHVNGLEFPDPDNRGLRPGDHPEPAAQIPAGKGAQIGPYRIAPTRSRCLG